MVPEAVDLNSLGGYEEDEAGWQAKKRHPCSFTPCMPVLVNEGKTSERQEGEMGLCV